MNFSTQGRRIFSSGQTTSIQTVMKACRGPSSRTKSTNSSTLVLGWPRVHPVRNKEPSYDKAECCEWACVPHSPDVLGVCVKITSALLRTETERSRGEYTILSCDPGKRSGQC